MHKMRKFCMRRNESTTCTEKILKVVGEIRPPAGRVRQ